MDEKQKNMEGTAKRTCTANTTTLFVRLNAINIFLGVAFTFVCYILQSSISKKT